MIEESIILFRPFRASPIDWFKSDGLDPSLRYFAISGLIIWQYPITYTKLTNK